MFFTCFCTSSFTNFAFHGESTDITSCTRPDLLECAIADNENSTRCQQQKYGEITADLFAEIGTFFVDDNDVFIFVTEDANVALDNVRIAPIGNATDQSILFSVTNGTAMIVDSVIDDGYDIGYNANQCNVILNERLDGDNDSISRLIIECNNFEFDGEYGIQNVMDSSTRSFVEYFSASMIEIRPQSTSYYPGMNLQFNQSVIDRLGNVIVDGLIQNTSITVSSASFSSILWFDADGYCQICEEGVWLSDISLADDVGQQYILQVAADNNRLVLDQSELTLDIIGCPAGHGADSDNFTCSICEADTYNLEDGSLRQCSNCDAVNNPGILCCFRMPRSWSS